jgi:hypothetical protein
MTKLDNFIGVANKLRSGHLEYCLWTDNLGGLYVQITKNLLNTPNEGTHSDLLFKLSDILRQDETDSKPKGLTPDTFKSKKTDNNNDAGFLKAIARQLLPEIEELYAK